MKTKVNEAGQFALDKAIATKTELVWPEDVENLLTFAYPGLPEFAYKSIAHEAQERDGTLQTAKEIADRAWLEMNAQKPNVAQQDTSEYFA